MKYNDEINPEAARRLMDTLAANIEFPMFLKMVRLAAGMERLELAAKARMSTGYLGQLENGRARPSPRALANLVDALPMPPELQSKFLELAARKQIESHRPTSQQAKFTPRPVQMPPMTPEEAAALSEIMQRRPALPDEPDEPPAMDVLGKAGKPPQRLFIAYPGCPPALVATGADR